MDRAERRHRWQRRRQWAVRLWTKVWGVKDDDPNTAKNVHLLAETHGRPCSCEGCKRGPTKQMRMDKVTVRVDQLASKHPMFSIPQELSKLTPIDPDVKSIVVVPDNKGNPDE